VKAAAAVSIAAAVVLLLRTVREIGWRRTFGLTDEPRHPEEPRLVIGGPFRLVRHPVALAAILALAGLALAARSLSAALGGAVVSGFIALAARRSESALVERFGEVYRRYQRAAPFLLPRLPAARRGRGP